MAPIFFIEPDLYLKKLIHRTTQGRWGLSVLNFAVGS